MESFAKIKRNRMVQEQVPAFVAEEHQTFVKFLEAYYEFLSEKQFVTSEKFVDYLDADSVPQEFLTHFWEEIKDIPGTVIADKRLLSKHIRDLYASKGTRKSIELLFRILYNETIKIYEPKEDMLRSSDGKWVNRDIIRTRVPLNFDLTSLNGKKLYQYNDFEIELCQFIVSDVSIVNTDAEYLYVEITPSTLVGRVFSDRLLYTKNRTTSLEIVQTFAISGYPVRGSNYKSGDIFFSGLLPCYVETVGTGSIDDIFIIDGGSGYTVGDYLVIDENDAAGTGLSVLVTRTSGSGSVEEIRIINRGIGYEELPKIVGNGSGVFYPHSSTIGRVLSVSVKDASSDNNPVNLTSRAIVSNTIGLFGDEDLIRQGTRIRNENGLGLLAEDGSHFLPEETLPEVVIGQVFEVEDDHTVTISGNFGTGNLFSETDQRFILENGDGFSTEETTTPLDRFTVRGQDSGVIFDILHVNPAKINSRLEPIYRVSSRFVNEDGFVSQPNKKIQDSLFYQDFSYVIQSSQSFENYKNILYKMIHPAGMAVFGEVQIDSYVLTVENRIRKAFDELRLVSNAYLKLEIGTSSSLTLKNESNVVSGTSYDFLDKYKFILGENYGTGTYGVSAMTGAREFNRLESISLSNWKISDFSYIKFNDMYSYDGDYYTDTPLTLNGVWQLDGAETLDGTYAPTPTNVLGKFKIKRDKRIPFSFGVELTISPTFPIEDEVVVADSLSYSMTAMLAENLTASDATSWISNFNYTIAETTIASDVLNSLRTFNNTIAETITSIDTVASRFTAPSSLVSTVTSIDRVAIIGTNAPKDSTTSTDVVSWVIGTTTGINETTFNAGPL